MSIFCLRIISSKRSRGPSYRGSVILRSSITISNCELRIELVKNILSIRNPKFAISSNLHSLSNFHHCLRGHGFGLSRTVIKDVEHVGGMGLQFLPPRTHRLEALFEILEKPHLAFDAAYSSGATTLVHPGQSFL